MENQSETKIMSDSFDVGKKVSRIAPGWYSVIFLSLIVSIVVSLSTIFIYNFKYAQKIVSIDIKGYTEAQGREFISGRISEQEFRKRFDRLQKVVESIPPNKAVLMGDLVVRNVEIIKP